MSPLRPAELRGRWYPGTSEACSRFLESLAPPAAPLPRLPARRLGAVVPHAGWLYSGAIAYRALAALAEPSAVPEGDGPGAVRRSRSGREWTETSPRPELVIVFGGHLGSRDRPRILLEGGWETPFGALPIAEGLAQDLSMAVESELESAEEFYDDNAIEVLLPFVKRLWPEVQVLTIGVPPTDEAPRLGVEAVDLARRRGFREILVVGSTDLTHYGPNYNYQPHGRGRAGHTWVKEHNDPELLGELVKMDPARVLWVAARARSACCAGAVAACISAARKLGATGAVLLEHATSWEVRPGGEEPASFVGYAGVVLGAD